MGLFLKSKLYLIDLYVYIYATLISCSFVVSFEIGEYKSSNFYSFQNCFGFSVPFAIPYEFY